MNINYSQFYKGSTSLNTYGSSPNQLDTLAKYEFNTTDENGNKVMDKMTKQETLDTMKDIRSQYSDNVILEFSGDGMAALVDSKNGAADSTMTPAQQEAMKKKNEAFQQEIKQCNVSVYPGTYGTVVSPVKDSGIEEQGHVNEFIQQNFPIENNSSISDAKLRESISLDAEKAESVPKADSNVKAESYIKAGSNVKAERYVEAGSSVIAESYVEADSNVKTDYGVEKSRHLGKSITYAFSEYQKMNAIFAGISTGNKRTFIDNFKPFSKNNSNSHLSKINRKFANRYW